jgi:hypothetical protein
MKTTLAAFMKICLIPLVLISASNCSDSDPTGPGGGSGGTSGFEGQIDHSCTDISSIPDQWITEVIQDAKLHYAHTSHGGQLTTGLELVEADDPDFSVEIGSSYLPSDSGALCIFDGQNTETYITPDLFWETHDGMNMTRAVLDGNPSISVCMWCWCTQMDYYGADQVQAYLDSMSTLELEYPSVTFVYMTGNAQNTGGEGYNRYLRNQQVREFCEDNGKVLFDFADLDSWWQDPSTSQWEQNTYSYSGTTIPLEHEEFNGDEAGHTTYESCRQKGRAVWWMLALIEGWDPN